jgi:hypothetical protein
MTWSESNVLLLIPEVEKTFIGSQKAYDTAYLLEFMEKIVASILM